MAFVSEKINIFSLISLIYYMVAQPEMVSFSSQMNRNWLRRNKQSHFFHLMKVTPSHFFIRPIQVRTNWLFTYSHQNGNDGNTVTTVGLNRSTTVLLPGHFGAVQWIFGLY